ncbi:hypothetical protein GC175_22065 [bacterium]|nr:hypothetical protein [bacterium]
MRKLLALLLLVAVVTSAFAFANSFDVNSLPARQGEQNISSGAAAVQHCIGDIGVDIVGGNYLLKLKDFEVDSVVLLTANAQCAGDSVTVTLTDKDGRPIGTVDGTLDSGGGATLNFADPLDVKVRDVANVHVLIEANRPSTIE